MMSPRVHTIRRTYLKNAFVSVALFLFAFFATQSFAALNTSEIKYKVGDQEFTGYLAYDDSIKDKRPGVLVVHEWWGHNEHARKRAEMLAGAGYTAFALDMFGTGKLADHPEDAKAMMMAMFGNMEETTKRFNAAKKILMEHKTVASDKIASIGFCMGGGLSMAMGRMGEDLDGIVVLHGTIGSKTPVAKGVMKAQVLALIGEADPFIPKEQIDAFKKEMDAAGVKYEVVSYPGAKHSFTNPAASEIGKKFNIPLEYNEAADKDSWKRTQNFLKDIFK